MSSMAKLIILPQAMQQLDEILANVIEFTGFEVSAIRLSDDIYDKLEQIGYMPLATGKLRDDGAREAFVRRYRIVYDFNQQQDEIAILAIIHSSRLYPRP